MSYEYAMTKAEEKAAKVLRDKGWSVQQPLCPECGGYGFVSKSEWIAESKFAMVGTTSTEPCPNGCTLMMFYGSFTDGREH